MKEEYFAYDDDGSGVKRQELEVDDIYEDVGNKFDDSNTRPVKRTQKATSKRKLWLYYIFQSSYLSTLLLIDSHFNTCDCFLIGAITTH